MIEKSSAKKTRGFTLFEMILALFLSTALLGTMTQIGITLSKSLSESRQERLFLSRLILLDQQLQQLSPTSFQTEDRSSSGKIRLLSQKMETSALLYLEPSRVKNRDLLKLAPFHEGNPATGKDGRVLIPDLISGKSALEVKDGCLKIYLVSKNGAVFEHTYYPTPKSWEAIPVLRK